MNRRLVGGLVALVIVLIGVWLLFLRGKSDGGNETAANDPSGPGKAGVVVPTAAPRTFDPVHMREGSRRWTLDMDVDGPLVMEGQVTGPDGKGVGGAEVWINTAPPRSVKSEDDGTFKIEKLVGRTYRLTAKSAELIGGPAMCKLTSKSDPCRIQLGEAAGAEVTVVDAESVPIAGAEVHEGDRDQGVVTTDAKGLAILRPLHPGWITVVATAAGFAPNSALLTVGSAGATGKVTIVMRKGFSVSGRVIDEAGKPIAHVHVYPATVWFDEDRANSPSVTDTDGKFTIEALPAGTHTLAALDGEHAMARSAPVTVTDHAVTGIEITMKPGGSVAGTVVDKDGKPVAFATVQVSSRGRMQWQESRRATTDNKGAFELRGLSRQKLYARAQLESVASQIVDLDLTTQDTIKDLKLVVELAGTISGIVVNDTGQPVSEVQVQAFPDLTDQKDEKAAALAGMTSATTDGAGNFTLDGLPEGSYNLTASRSNANRWNERRNEVKAKTGDKSVRIVMPSPGTLVGKIALESGSAPTLAYVQLGWQPPTPIYDGNIVVKDITPGTYDVTIRGSEFTEAIKHDIVIEAGKKTDLGTVTVQRGRRLSGTVVDSSGKAISGAKVKLAEMLFSLNEGEEQWESIEQPPGVRVAVTDQDGAFTIVGVPTKQTTAIAAHATAGKATAITIPEGTDDPPPVQFALHGYGTISGVVTMKGAPQPEITISESTRGGAAAVGFARTDESGAFHLVRVPEGVHVISAMKQERFTGAFKSGSVTVQVTAGADAKVTIDIPVGAVTLAVTVKPMAGQKVDWAQVFLLRDTQNPANAKELMAAFTGGGAAGMKFWFGGDTPMPEFDELVPGAYTACGIPITGGKFEDMTFQKKIQENMMSLKVYCKPVTVTAAPVKQAFPLDLPAMTPFPQ